MAKQRAIGIGYRTGQMKTAEGMVEFSAPQVRETPEPFVSAIRENLVGRTQALGSGCGTLCTRAVDPRHRRRLQGRERPAAAVPCGGERDHRAAVGGVRGLQQARSV
jgi:hypothetical protein